MTTALAATLSLMPGQRARASGLDAPVIGHGQSGPSTADAAAVHWNPGQLGFVSRPEVYFGGALLFVDIRYQRNRLGSYQTPDTLNYTQQSAIGSGSIDPSLSGPTDEVKTAFPVAATGNLFFAVPVLKDRIVLGGGLYVPSAAILEMPTDGPQKWQVQQAMILASKMGLSLGIKAADFLSLGVGVQYVLGFAELSKYQDFAAVDVLGDGLNQLGQANDFGADAPSEVRELDTLSRPLSLKRAWSHMVTFNAGIAARPTKKFGLNLAYEHSTPMKFNGDVAVDMNDPFFTQDLQDQGVKFPPLVQGKATLEFILPKRITLGLAYDINEKYRVDGFAQLSLYGQLDAFRVTMVSDDLVQEALGIGDTANVDLVRNWNHTVWVEGSFRARLASRWLLSATLGYMSPASPDSTVDLASIDGHRPLGALGGVFFINDRWSLYGDARFQGIIPRVVTTSDYDLGNGTYKLFIASLGLHARARF